MLGLDREGVEVQESLMSELLGLLLYFDVSHLCAETLLAGEDRGAL